jgi:hypothetical protein
MMISGLPNYINIVFILTTLLTVFLFYKATNRPTTSLIIITAWLLLQAGISFTGFYTVTGGFPPRLALMVIPTLLFILFLFITPKGRAYINNLDIKTLTLLHIVRIPVEVCLYWLFLYKSVPQLMTFEGRNFDILAGLTAPLIFYFGYIKTSLTKTVLLIWNIICLGLLLNIVVNALLSVPTPVQQFAFDQPNTGILYFPSVWLPGFIVPVVLLAHIASIRKLMLKS